jgi:hypothetical protein
MLNNKISKGCVGVQQNALNELLQEILLSIPFLHRNHVDGKPNLVTPSCYSNSSVTYMVEVHISIARQLELKGSYINFHVLRETQ